MCFFPETDSSLVGSFYCWHGPPICRCASLCWPSYSAFSGALAFVQERHFEKTGRASCFLFIEGSSRLATEKCGGCSFSCAPPILSPLPVSTFKTVSKTVLVVRRMHAAVLVPLVFAAARYMPPSYTGFSSCEPSHSFRSLSPRH